MYFAQSVDYWAEQLYRMFNFYYNSAGITQSLQNILDPSVVFSVIFILIAFVMLFSKKTKWSILPLVLIIGLIPQIKIYSGLIFYVGLGMLAIFELAKHRSINYFIVLALSGIISAIVYLPINSGAGGLIFAPLLIFTNFIDSVWIFNNWHWNVNFPIYFQAHNYLHIAYFYFCAMVMFFITSLGVRLLVVGDFRKLLHKDFYTSQNIFWGSMLVASFLIPSFFIQTVSSFSIIQFFWIGYVIILLPTAVAIGNLLKKTGRPVIALAILVFIVLVLPDNFKLLNTYSTEPSIIDKGFVNQMEIIKRLPQQTGLIVVNRVKVKNKDTGLFEYTDVFNSPIISALSGHSIYYEHELTQFQSLGNLVSTRISNIEKIQDNLTSCQNPKVSENNVINIMKQTDNQYLLILNKTVCSAQFTKLRLIHEEKYSIMYSI
jgi:hypothetical protein